MKYIRNFYFYLIKSVSVFYTIIVICKKYFRDFKQELFLFNYGIITNYLYVDKKYISKDINYQESNNNIKKNELGYYLAGLIESDGTIIIPNPQKNLKILLQYVLFFI
jgi:hypothetical protein